MLPPGGFSTGRCNYCVLPFKNPNTCTHYRSGGMAADKSKKDPFSYFFGGAHADLSDISDESSDVDDSTDGKTSETNDTLKKCNVESEKAATTLSTGSRDKKKTQQKLPTPDQLFDTVKKPKFLKDKQGREIDWYEMAMDKTSGDGEEEKEIEIKDTRAIPPPRSYEPVTPSTPTTLGDVGENTASATKRPHQDGTLESMT